MSPIETILAFVEVVLSHPWYFAAGIVVGWFVTEHLHRHRKGPKHG